MNALRKIKSFSPLAYAKLEASGINETQAAELGMYSVENAATLHRNFDGKPALVIPYFNHLKQPMRAHPAWPDFYRLRYLDDGVKGFKEAADGKVKRYTQPPDTGVCAYFPLSTNWKAILDATDQPILITEGELKAAKASLEGFATIGLGGVYNFRASKAGVFFLPELEAISWPRRRVVIVYDSDYTEKPNICAAINVLAEELQARGAMVELASLPNVYDDDRKTGLDDFLVARGDDALVNLLKQTEPLAMCSELWKLNGHILYVEDPGFVMAQRTGQKLSVPAFIGHSRWSTATVPECKVNKDGTMSYDKAAAAPVWLKWPLRQAVNKLTYRPGAEKFYTEKGEAQYNQWKGWGVQPKAGDVKPWLALIKFVFEGQDKEAVEWFLDWCAYPLQNPGVKMFSAALIWGRAKGTGKSLIFYTLKRIYGSNFIAIKNDDLKDTWWLENKQFILGEEISGSDKRTDSDSMKAMITQEDVNINIKYVPQFSVPDCANYGFTSNHADAIFLEDEDRRYFVHEVMHDAPMEQSFYNDYDAWKNSDEGPAALFHWLMQRDVKKFNPRAPAYKTAAHKRMTLLGKSDVATWCHELKENAQYMLRIGQMRHTRDLFTATELMNMYLDDHQSQQGKITVNGFSRQLSNAGFKQVLNSAPVMINGKQGRYFAARNAAVWAKCKNAKEIAKHINQAPVRD